MFSAFAPVVLVAVLRVSWRFRGGLYLVLAGFADLLWSWWFLILVLCALVGGFVGLFPWIVAWRCCWVLGFLV